MICFDIFIAMTRKKEKLKENPVGGSFDKGVENLLGRLGVGKVELLKEPFKEVGDRPTADGSVEREDKKRRDNRQDSNRRPAVPEDHQGDQEEKPRQPEFTEAEKTACCQEEKNPRHMR